MKKESSHKSKSKRDDDDEEEGEESEEYNSDIDGVKKKQGDVRGYEKEDEEDQDLKRRLSRPSDNPEGDIKEEEKDLSKYCNVLREKFSKYFGYIRGINYEKDKSATVIIGFPLEFSKVLMLTVAEGILAKTLVRSISGIEKCILINPDKVGDLPYLLV